MISDQTLETNIKAVIQPRIYSSKKSVLEDAIPLQTPYSVHIYVCSLCNFKCSFCFQADILGKKKKGFPHGFMEFDLFKKTSYHIYIIEQESERDDYT